MRRLAVLLAGLAALVLAAPAAAVSAAPTTNAKVIMHFDNLDPQQGQSVPLQYTTTRLPSHTSIQLQRTFGTGRVFETVAVLPRSGGRSRTTYTPAPGQGVYFYRILAVQYGRVIARTWNATMYSFAPVSFATICGAAQNGVNCQYQTQQVGNTVFGYEADANAGQFFNFSGTTCRSGSIQFAIDPNSGDGFNPPDQTSTATVGLVQQDADPASATVGYQQVGNFNFSLTGAGWIVNVSSQTADDSDSTPQVFLNGTFNCYSASGF